MQAMCTVARWRPSGFSIGSSSSISLAYGAGQGICPMLASLGRIIMLALSVYYSRAPRVTELIWGQTDTSSTITFCRGTWLAY